MIVGYNLRGEKVDEFKNISEMSRALNMSPSALFESFRVHRKVDTNGVIYHVGEGLSVQDPAFSEDFGYPQPKCLDEQVEYTPEDGNSLFEAPYGTIIVTPMDPWYNRVKNWYDMKDAKCAEQECLYREAMEEQAHAKEQEQNFIDMTQTRADIMDGSFGGTITRRGSLLDKLMKGAREKVEKVGTPTDITSDDELGGKDGGSYSANGSSAHYKKAVLEYIDKQERCYGTFLAYSLCFMQVDKYRDRAGKKEGVPVDKDMTKAGWYDTVAITYFIDKINLYNETGGDNVAKNRAFDEKYGNGRHEYITMPAQLFALLSGEMGFGLDISLKGLGDIVNEQQSK